MGSRACTAKSVSRSAKIYVRVASTRRQRSFMLNRVISAEAETNAANNYHNTSELALPSDIASSALPYVSPVSQNRTNFCHYALTETHLRLESLIVLQIASGKLFTNEPRQRNELRGVLHTNLCLLPGTHIETTAGRLLPTDTNSKNRNQLIYEFTELIEDEPSSGVIASHGIDAYTHDFAALVSLGLNVMCTVEPNDTDRLIGRQRSTKLLYPPSSFIPRVFDHTVWLKQDELEPFIHFVNSLIALNRRVFLAAIRAIRTYVVALHRLPDDPELAYTLFVASIESLAQTFDNFQAEWTDYDNAKKKRIDAALVNADRDTKQRIRKALLETEHLLLARRFREFAIAHIGPDYFREETLNVEVPASRPDLEEALRSAYRIRSRFIHNLRELPRPLLISLMRGDTICVEGKTLFTFRGIARLARYVILEFIQRQPKVEKEKYDYRDERYGIVSVPLAPQYWIGKPNNLRLDSATKRFEGFLNQVSSCFQKNKDAAITDLQPMLQRAEKLFASSNPKQRRSMLALYFLFNALIPNERRMPNLATIEHKYGTEIDAPSIEAMFVHLVLQVRPDWSLDTYQRLYDAYFEQRKKKDGLMVPRTLEAGIALELAERFRLECDFEAAIVFVGQAVECFPKHKPLQLIENSHDPHDTIHWFDVIFPESAATIGDSSDIPS